MPKPAATSTTFQTDIEENPRQPNFADGIIFALSIMCCTTLLLLSRLPSLAGNTSTVLKFSGTPVVLLSATILNHWMPREPSHLPFHFFLYLWATCSTIFLCVPFETWFESISNPTAWLAGPSFALLESFFCALFSIYRADLGWYGTFRYRVYQFYSATGQWFKDLAIEVLLLIVRHFVNSLAGGDGQVTNSAGNEPLFDDVVEGDHEPSLPPPYFYDMDVAHEGHWYKKIDGA